MTKLSDVNTRDILDAIRLGCRTMERVFNADDDDIPFFSAEVRPQVYMGFSGAHSESHVPGRHLNALLNAESSAGIQVDETAIEKHARAAFFSYGGTVPLPLNRQEVGGPLVNFRSHNVREGLHALYSLVKFRDSQNARRLAEASIETVFALWDSVGGWDVARLEGEHGISVLPDGSFISGLARAIGPLVKYYRATRYGPALELAIVLKEKALDEAFTEDGSYDEDRFGSHCHSTTCVMSSLAQLADPTHDSALMGRVKAFFDNGLWDIRDAIGWSIETSGTEGNSGRGEANNTGDILETALILGRWGHTEKYHDAERILRCHLLPSQLRDTSFIVSPANPEGADGRRDVADRLRGAFGFPAPYGHEPLGIMDSGRPRISFNLDIVGGAVGSLCEAYREATRHDDAGHWVNLLFDHETEAIKVKSPYTHAALGVTVRRAGPLFVRIPPWVDPELVHIEGAEGGPRPTNGYLFFASPLIGRRISLEFPMAGQEITLGNPAGEIRARLRGDEVEAMDGFGADLTFFDPID